MTMRRGMEWNGMEWNDLIREIFTHGMTVREWNGLTMERHEME
jgi:hypothetical protein